MLDSKHPSDHTAPLSVGNMAFMLDRFGQDCHPLQFLRELTENSIQAIKRTKSAGEILWDVDWNFYDLHGTYKLSIIDTGDGMTGPEMERYINKLSSSIEEQAFDKNFGIGAKIAALTRNPAGVVYRSWKNGQGTMVYAWKSLTDQVYGLKQLERANGTYSHHLDVEDEIKPPIIKEHGTHVTLIGASVDANTMQPPEGTQSPSRWVAKYLNTRYFHIPPGITIKAREGWEHPREDSARNKLRTITGQERYLDEHCSSKGDVALKGAKARWWILKDTDALSQDSNYFASSGHTAALYQNELYDLSFGRAARSRLQELGVIFGFNQVVVYIEPTQSENQRLTTNTARTQLLLNNEALPWAEWAIQFSEALPKEIEELIAEKAAGTSGLDHTSTIKNRLKSIMDLYKVTRYRLTAQGRLQVDPDNLVPGTKSHVHFEDPTPPAPPRPPRPTPDTAANIFALFEKKGGAPGERVEPDPFPKVQWISTETNSREPGQLEDRAAQYILEQNLLQINGDFRVFSDMVKHYHKEFGSSPAIKEMVRDVVRAWFEQSLVEAVIGIKQLQNSKEWSDSQIRSALSEEALTTAVVPRYHVNVSTRRELASRLGSKTTRQSPD